MGKLLNTKYD